MTSAAVEFSLAFFIIKLDNEDSEVAFCLQILALKPLEVDRYTRSDENPLFVHIFWPYTGFEN